jgi:predicted nuclease of restriction endonuclease-like RecB superfamily
MTDRTPLKARPTTYKGIRMRSRTEAAYAARLDAAGLSWEYEPRCFANERAQYLPDFRVTDRGCTVYIEVKGVLPLAEVEAVQRRMETILDSEPTAMLVLVITSSGVSYHQHPDEPGEWFHQNPTYWAETVPVPSSTGGPALGAVRSAGTPKGAA